MRNRLRYLLALIMLTLCMFIGGGVSSVYAETMTEPNIISTTDGTGDNDGTDGGESDVESEEVPEESEDNPVISGPVFKGFPITSNVILDEYLYSALLQIYEDYYETKTGRELPSTFNTIYSDMFADFEVINLDGMGISSLEGLDKLQLPKLVCFSANENFITAFNDSVLENVNGWTFSELSLANNEISSVDVSSLVGLRKVNLSCNKLSSVDLSSIKGKTSGTEIAINLAGNEISSISKIKLPNTRISHINLNIIRNNITDLTEEYFSDMYTLNVGVQGYISDKPIKTDTDKGFIVYKTNVENLKIKVIKTDGDEDEDICTISDADITGNFLKLPLEVGDYRCIYILNDEEIYSKDSYYNYCEFGVIPQKLTVKYVYKEKEYSELGKVTGSVTVKLFSNDEGAEIFYQLNGGEWIKGSVVECNNGGNYSIRVKAEVDGYESEYQTVWVRTSLNRYIPDVVMLVLVVLLTLVLFFVVLPIVSKKYFKKD